MNRREFKENLFYTAIFVLFAGTGAFVLLQIFGIEIGPRPVPGPQTETVHLVLYYSDGDFDWKAVGEMILIDTGEVLQVKRNRIRPDPKYIVNDYNNGFQPAQLGPPQIGLLPLKLDRKNGIACLQEKCTTLYAIVPMESKIRQGEKSVSYSRP